MPRWRALPEELDPQVGEFTEQLRRLVERSGLGLGALADRTGYSKTSWERYLNGRLLPPLGAAEALADVTGADVGHLSTMWELAERAWSRSELRHDVTMEAVRIAQARAALGEFGPPARPAKPAPPLCREA
ncbi:helix-turn-helix transcriptional regulator, partial [Streptomyces sp. NPDC020667]